MTDWSLDNRQQMSLVIINVQFFEKFKFCDYFLFGKLVFIHGIFIIIFVIFKYSFIGGIDMRGIKENK